MERQAYAMYLFFFLPSRYELTMAAFAGLVIALLTAASKKPGRVSALAVFSFVWGVANPTLVYLAYRQLKLPWIALGDSELRAWFAGTLAIVLGLVARQEIRESQGKLWGQLFAWLGIVSGAPWSLWGFYLGLQLLLQSGPHGHGP